MKCPQDGGTMRRIRNRGTGLYFYGCDNYPNCKMTMTEENYRRLTGAPPQTLEEEEARQTRMNLGDGEDYDPTLKPKFWDEDGEQIPDDFAGIHDPINEGG